MINIINNDHSRQEDLGEKELHLNIRGFSKAGDKCHYRN